MIFIVLLLLTASILLSAYFYIMKLNRKLKSVKNELWLQSIELQESQNSLYSSNERYIKACEVSISILWEWDLNSNKVKYSPKFYELTGYSKKELGDDIDFFHNIIHTEDFEEYTKKYEKFFSGKLSIFEHEYRIKLKNETYLWIFTISKGVKNANGSLIKVAGSHTDISGAKAQGMFYKVKNELEEDLRQAICKNQLQVYYQPQINVVSGRIECVEALVRWRHHNKGLISPGDFIPLAEETGLIQDIGKWVLEEACRQNKAWQDSGIEPVCVAVNLSAKQFYQEDLPQMVLEILNKTKLDPRYLELEITESIAIHDIKKAINILNIFKSMGIKISLDDFGTGYSSFYYLKNFPISNLKIDKAFLEDISKDGKEKEIARTIISLAHSIDLTVIAEGVEEEEQMDFLKKNKCDKVQGFLFSKPVPVNEVEALIKNQSYVSEAV